MKTLNISGKKRESVGKVSTKALRNAGFVPCVVYGGSDQPLHIALEEKALKDLVYTPNVYTVELDLEGDKISAVMQDIQFHPVTDKILHIDFVLLSEDRQVSLFVPVKTVGTSPGVMKGGNLRIVNRKVKIKAFPSKLPDDVTVDISSLEIGNKVYVEALRNDNYEFMHPDNMVVVDVKISRAAMKAAQEETASE